MEKLDSLKSIQKDSPKDIRISADLLDVVVTIVKEAKCEDKLGYGTFYQKFL